MWPEIRNMKKLWRELCKWIQFSFPVFIPPSPLHLSPSGRSSATPSTQYPILSLFFFFVISSATSSKQHLIVCHLLSISTTFSTKQLIICFLLSFVSNICSKAAYLLTFDLVSHVNGWHMYKVLQNGCIWGDTNPCSNQNTNVILIPVLLPSTVRSI